MANTEVASELKLIIGRAQGLFHGLDPQGALLLAVKHHHTMAFAYIVDGLLNRALDEVVGVLLE